MIPVRATREFLYLRRPVLVAVSLADLRGAASGVVELPLHLFWSGRDSRDSWFSLDEGPGRRVVYRTVLREARSPDDLATFLNGDVLTVLWADIVLPKVVRMAWEEQHPVLRPVAPCGVPALAGRLAGPSTGPRRNHAAVGASDDLAPGTVTSRLEIRGIHPVTDRLCSVHGGGVPHRCSGCGLRAFRRRAVAYGPGSVLPAR